ncbi:hypothetical protein HYW75_02780 [Candidatus Pacearchaeota archaeon]|nr:hypothetical protein [Candidatus Pacearchaeota archaeon]
MKKVKYHLNKNLNIVFAKRPSFYKDTIEDKEFKEEWEKEKKIRLKSQKNCFYCDLPFNKERIPILHHRNMPLKEEEAFKKRADVSIKVINGEMKIEEANIIYLKLTAELTQYYKSLVDTDLICTNCHQLQHNFSYRKNKGRRKL